MTYSTRPFLAALFGLCVAGAAQAQSEDICASVVNGEQLRFDRATFLEDAPNITRRERLLAWPGRKLDGLRGRDPECDSETLIRYLSLTIPADEIDGYCLNEVGTFGFLLIPGARNFRGRCTGTVCDVVNTTAQTAGDITTATTRNLADSAKEKGVAGLLHSSGAALLTGQASAITGTLGSIGSGLATALSTPAVLAAGAVTVVAVGGAVYVCRD